MGRCAWDGWWARGKGLGLGSFGGDVPTVRIAGFQDPEPVD